MNCKYINVMLVVAVSSMMAVPSYARGGFGGFGGGGRSFGSFGGGGRSFGSSDFGGHNFGGAERNFGGGDFGGDRSFAGADRSFSGDRSGSWGSLGGDHNGSWGSMGGTSSFSGRPENNGVWNRPSTGGNTGFGNHIPTDGGFGGISGLQNRTPHNISQNTLNDQGNKVRNSFNNDNFNRTNVNNVNNVNVNRGYGGYGGYGYHGYHPYDNGYAHGWAASNAYHGGYWGYPGAWGCAGWSEATMWTCMGLSSLTAFLGLGMMGAEMSSNKNNNNANTNTIIYPVSNVTYQGDTVYVNGQASGTSAQYYQQAQQLAAQGIASTDTGSYPAVAPDYTGASATVSTASASAQGKWAPLGVFSLAEPGQTQSNMMVQLAISPQGQVRGNYMNQLTNEKSQIYGQLDKKTQRISWTIGENNTTVFDTSLAALTKDDSQVLVHYGPNNTGTMALIRLQQPANNGNTTAAAPPTS